MNYAIYARKSSEGEDRQVQSIDDQLRSLNELAERRGYRIVTTICEAKSAKTARSRPEFQELLKLIDAGKVQGVLCWNVNRLSRNSIDFAEMQDRLQRKLLLAIETPERSYRPEDSMLLYYVEAGMSNQYVLDLSKAVLRGLSSKVEKGWWPHKAPEGYINELAEHTIQPDPERLQLIQRAFRLLLTKSSTVGEVIGIMNDEWGYRTRKRRKTGGSRLSESAGYRMFSNIFYTGRMLRNGEVIQGSHQAIVSLQEFDEVQQIIRRGGYRKRAFVFNGTMRCVHCGHSVVGSIQSGRHKKSPAVYYACGGKLCPSGAKGSIREDRLERQVLDELQKVTWPKWYKEVILKELKEYYRREYDDLAAVAEQEQRSLASAERKRSSLLDLKLEGGIDTEDFTSKDRELKAEIAALRSRAADVQASFDQAWETVNRVCDFIVLGYQSFQLGDAAKKREILGALGTEYRFDNGKVSIQTNPLLPYNLGLLEPLETGSDSTKKDPETASFHDGCTFGNELEPFHSLFLLASRGHFFPALTYCQYDTRTELCGLPWT